MGLIDLAYIIGVILGYILPSAVLYYTGLIYWLSLLKPPCMLRGQGSGSVSVVLAAREEPLDLIKRYCSSLSSQSTKPIELIIAWDGEGFEQVIEQAKKIMDGIKIKAFVAGCNSKACALNKALRYVEGSHILVIDVDDVPSDSRYIDRSTYCSVVIPYWLPTAPQSIFEEAIAAMISYGSRVLYSARCRLGRPLLYLGSGSSVASRVIRGIKGFPDEVLEDLAIGIKLLEAGVDICYGENHILRVGLPPTYTAFRRQQCRWAQGAIRLLRLLSTSKLPLTWRMELSLYLMQYMLAASQIIGLALVALLPYNPTLSLCSIAYLLWLGGIAVEGLGLYHYLVREEKYSPFKGMVVAVRASLVAQACLPRILTCSLKGILRGKQFIKTPKTKGEKDLPIDEIMLSITSILLVVYSISIKGLPNSIVVLPLLLYPLSLAYVYFRLRKWIG